MLQQYLIVSHTLHSVLIPSPVHTVPPSSPTHQAAVPSTGLVTIFFPGLVPRIQRTTETFLTTIKIDLLTLIQSVREKQQPEFVILV